MNLSYICKPIYLTLQIKKLLEAHTFTLWDITAFTFWVKEEESFMSHCFQFSKIYHFFFCDTAVDLPLSNTNWHCPAKNGLRGGAVSINKEVGNRAQATQRLQIELAGVLHISENQVRSVVNRSAHGNSIVNIDAIKNKNKTASQFYISYVRITEWSFLLLPKEFILTCPL